MERKWHEKYDDPDIGPQASELLWDQHAAREFEGDEELEANLNRKAFTHRDRTDFTVGDSPSEGDLIDGMAAFQPRSWKKPQWRKANTAYARRTRNLKRGLARIRTGLTRVVRFVIQKTAQSKKAAEREVDAAGRTPLPRKRRVVPADGPDRSPPGCRPLPWHLQQQGKQERRQHKYARSAEVPDRPPLTRRRKEASGSQEAPSTTGGPPWSPSVSYGAPWEGAPIPPWRQPRNKHNRSSRPSWRQTHDIEDLDLLEEVPSLMALGTAPTPPKREWVRVDFTVDSGSATSCIPAAMVSKGRVEACDGVDHYTSASNHKVVVVGRICPLARFQNHVEGKITLKVLEGLKKPLLSTSCMIKAGYRISHDLDGSKAVDTRTGAEYKIYERGGIFVMPIWLDGSFLCHGRAKP